MNFYSVALPILIDLGGENNVEFENMKITRTETDFRSQQHNFVICNIILTKTIDRLN